jgi:hypothetical protein
MLLNMLSLIVKNTKEPREQRLQERFKSNFQTRNKIKLHDSKVRIQEFKTKT